MSASDIKLELLTAQSVGGEAPADGVPVLVSVKTPDSVWDKETQSGPGRTNSDICVVIDVSGSMGAEATIQSAGGATESHGLSLLDIAKHGVKTVIHTLGPNDRLSVVWFNHTSEILFSLMKMDEAGKQQADKELERLQEGGGTNIWQGLSKALEVLRCSPEPGHLGHIMLLTDGQTSERASVMQNLKAFKDKYERLPGTISTFGFGYNIDSELLCDMAAMGDALYAFIPDAGFVGTIFVNTMSNLLVTLGREATLNIDAEEGCQIISAAGLQECTTTENGAIVKLGTLQHGQSRGVVLRVQPAADGSIHLFGKVQFEDSSGQKVETQEVECNKDSPPTVDAEQVESQRLRCLFTDTLAQAVSKASGRQESHLQEAAQLVAKLSEEIANAKASCAYLAALAEDVNGQTTEAVSRIDYYWRWGCHYLPSIMFAHKIQQCNNFKDPSVQLYGGIAFTAVQEVADSTFNDLPPPKPSRAAYRPSSTSGRPAAAAPAAPTNMAAYNDRYGVCIDSSSLVQMESGDFRAAGRLVKGDKVAGPDGAVAEVRCVVRTSCASGQAWLVQLPGGARVTPYHPVNIGGCWRFPAELADAQLCSCQAVCSLALDGAPAALLQGGVPAATLGHGLSEGAAAHEYFGTQAVLKDLARAPGFESGLVEIMPEHVLRDQQTGLVCGFSF